MKQHLLTLCIAASILWMASCSDNGAEKNCSGFPTVSAGPDQTVVDETTVTLAGTVDGAEGTWSIVEGSGGNITVGASETTFTGEAKTTYKLRLAATNECGSSSDDVTITMNISCGPTQTVDNFVSNIHWIEQSCFRIETSAFTIYTDPNSITTNDVADIVMISHPHDDHYSAANLDKIVGPKTILIAPEEVTYTGTIGKRVILKPGETYEAFGCVTIKAVPAYNIKKSYHLKTKNWVGYVVTVDGVTFYHTGDTERVPEMKDITTDIVMLPMGQTYTFDTIEEAVEVAKDVKAKVAIPMHFGLYEGTADDATSFKNLLDGVIPVVIKVKGQ